MPPHDQYAQVLEDLDQKVEERMSEVQRAHGYVDDDGDPSMAAVKEAAYQILRNQCVVGSKTERSKKAVTRGDLYYRVYSRPDAPGAGVTSIDDLDTVEKRAYNELADDVWDLTQASRSGWVQKRLGDDEETLVLCRRKIHRPTEAVLAVYLTDNETLIREDGTDKVVVSLMRRASVIRRDLDMVLTRHPKLRGPLAAQLASELKKIQAELTLPPPAEELGAGSDGSVQDEPAVPAGV
jgi:hypothetical protein